MGVVTASLLPKRMATQMMAILSLSLLLLLTVMTLLEINDRDSALEWAERGSTLDRLRRMKPLLESLHPDQVANFLEFTSLCHEGYTVTEKPFPNLRPDPKTEALQFRIATALGLSLDEVYVGETRLTRADFSYGKCTQSEIDLPMDAVVISVALKSGFWLNAEVHPHEWHIQDLIGWMARASSAFLFIGGLAIFFIYRLSKPLDRLTEASRRFGSGLEVSPVPESGPLDLRRAIQSFNAMQRQVSEEVSRRTNTLAAISHDLRTPLTALRVKAELIEDGQTRGDLITSIDRMEKLTASALSFLRGESRHEPMREVNLTTLVESECRDFSELGETIIFEGESGIQYRCRPEALARAVRNLIENALKYGEQARVAVHKDRENLRIEVSDKGSGIPQHLRVKAKTPFVRLSKARESTLGGFGLGLAVVEAIARGHDGELILSDNRPQGLIAEIKLPVRPEPTQADPT